MGTEPPRGNAMRTPNVNAQPGRVRANADALPLPSRSVLTCVAVIGPVVVEDAVAGSGLAVVELVRSDLREFPPTERRQEVSL
ncbi:MAG: hypothetical protein CO108_25440 [Deltaproteobacteria bacterium CG_4_9_14_3_um_filter_63_12]|nr:MAG: hypothetical protein CO108_25440 [Deltaproteobacteria bacterium CG_4_9_14_3_um_filter_63_12]